MIFSSKNFFKHMAYKTNISQKNDERKNFSHFEKNTFCKLLISFYIRNLIMAFILQNTLLVGWIITCLEKWIFMKDTNIRLGIKFIILLTLIPLLTSSTYAGSTTIPKTTPPAWIKTWIEKIAPPQITLPAKQIPLQYEILIIGHKNFLPALEILRKFKNATGRGTALISWQDIDKDKNYSTGRDIQEKIKMAIEDYNHKFKVKYVLLVGDADTFPVRYIPSQEAPDTQLFYRNFSDLYYADLYKKNGSFDNWDYNNDNIIGQYARYNPINYDRIDYHPDVYIGRIPASNVLEVKNYVSKVIKYESSEPYKQAWFKNALFVAPGYKNPNNGKYYDEVGATGLFNDIIKNYLAPKNIQAIRLFDKRIEGIDKSLLANETDYLWQSAPPESGLSWDDYVGSVINDYLNKGVSLAVFGGHGERTGCCMAALDAKYKGDNPPAGVIKLSDKNNLPVVLAYACGTAKFAITSNEPYVDVNLSYQENGETPNITPIPHPLQIEKDDFAEAMPEYMLVKSPSGAIAYLGTTSYGDMHTYVAFEKFVEGLYKTEHTTFGEAWKYMVEEYYKYYDLDNIKGEKDDGTWSWVPGEDFFAGQKFALFGDPSIPFGGLYNKKVDPIIIAKLLDDLNHISEPLASTIAPACDPYCLCDDTDPSKDYAVKGEQKVFDGKSYQYFSDACDGMALQQYNCVNGLAKKSGFACPKDTKCTNGICLSSKPTCVDTDVEMNTSTAGTVTISTVEEGTINEASDACDPATPWDVIEQTCSADGSSIVSTKKGCASGEKCKDGVCKKAYCRIAPIAKYELPGVMGGVWQLKKKTGLSHDGYWISKFTNNVHMFVSRGSWDLAKDIDKQLIANPKQIDFTTLQDAKGHYKTMADFNKDTYPDFMYLPSGEDKFYIYTTHITESQDVVVDTVTSHFPTFMSMNFCCFGGHVYEVTDMNNDGINDLIMKIEYLNFIAVVHGSKNPLIIDAGNSSDNFWTSDSDSKISFIRVGDINGDGVKDILAVAQEAEKASFNIYFGNIVNGKYSATKTTVEPKPMYFPKSTVNFIDDLLVNDVNNDGHDDIIATFALDDQKSVWNVQIWDGKLITSNLEPVASYGEKLWTSDLYGKDDLNLGNTSLAFGDVNGDGLQDLVVVWINKFVQTKDVADDGKLADKYVINFLIRNPDSAASFDKLFNAIFISSLDIKTKNIELTQSYWGRAVQLVDVNKDMCDDIFIMEYDGPYGDGYRLRYIESQ